MTTERLTPEEVLHAELLGHLQFRLREKVLMAMKDYAAQEVEHNTNRLQAEIDILKLALRRMLSYLDKGKAPYPGSFVYEDTKKVLNKLNQINEN